MHSNLHSNFMSENFSKENSWIGSQSYMYVQGLSFWWWCNCRQTAATCQLEED